MLYSHKDMQDYLCELDSQQNYIKECKIYAKITSIIKKQPKNKVTQYDNAERDAFDRECGGGQKADANILKYWTDRAENSKHPILKSRYACAVIIREGKTHVTLMRIAINANIKICDYKDAPRCDRKKKIIQALNFAININDEELIEKSKDVMIRLEQNIAEDKSAGTWGFSFDNLLLKHKKKIAISKKEEEKLLQDMRDRLLRVKKNNFFLAKHAVELLAEYYRKNKKEQNLKEVLETLEESAELHNNKNNHPLSKRGIYDKLYVLFKKYEDCKAIKDLRNRVYKKRIRSGKDIPRSLKEYPVTVEMQGTDNIKREIFNTSCPEKILKKFSTRCLPETESVPHSKLRKCVTSYYVDTNRVRSQDCTDCDKIMNLSIHFLRLSNICKEIKKQISKKQMMNLLSASIIFSKENKKYLEKAIHAYWEDQYIFSSHLFIPIIETAVRCWNEQCGKASMYRNKKGGDNYSSLNLEKIDSRFKSYFEEALSENGWNLRNDFAHGSNKEQFFKEEVSNCLFHIITCLFLMSEGVSAVSCS